MGIFRDQWKVKPEHVAEDLFEAAQWILSSRMA